MDHGEHRHNGTSRDDEAADRTASENFVQTASVLPILGHNEIQERPTDQSGWRVSEYLGRRFARRLDRDSIDVDQ